MSNEEIAKILIIFVPILLFILIALVGFLVFLKFKSQKNDNKPKPNEVTNMSKSKVQQSYNIQSIFNFMEFEKIEDNMIVQKKRKKIYNDS